MTEAEWLACGDSDALLYHLTGTTVSPRKKRLLACGCCRLIWDLLEEPGRQAVVVSERFADGLADADELKHAAQTAQAAWEDRDRRFHGWMTGKTLYFPPRTPEEERLDSEYHALYRAERAAFAAMQAAWPRMENGDEIPWDELYDRTHFVAFHWMGPRLASSAAFAARRTTPVEWPALALVRDLFGNPFRPPAVDRARLSDYRGAIPNLARAIYDEHHFEDLPVLADALEEAGCADPDLLAHCRGPGPHVRGCWVVDQILRRA
jgi:hypothetical protein